MPSPTLIYAEQHLFKTTELGKLARYIYEKTGKPCRMIHADNGGVGHIQEWIDGGIIDYLRIAGEENPLPMLQALQKGFWHRHVDGNGVSKLLAPGQSMEVNSRSRGKITLTNDLSNVGGYFFEGLTSIAELLFMDLLRKARQLGEKPSYSFTEPSFDPGKAEELIGGGNRQYYNHVQYIMKQMLISAASLPVPYLFITGHEGKGKDEYTEQRTLGPAIIGSAYTSKVGKDIGDMFHIQRETVVETVKDAAGNDVPRERQVARAYFVPHRDPETGMMWPAVARISIFNNFGQEDKVASESNRRLLLKRFPYGFIELEQDAEKGIVEFVRMKDELLATKTESVKKWKEEMDRKRAEATAAPAAAIVEGGRK